MAALIIDNLHYHYSSDMLLKRFHALKGVSLEIKEGEFFGFLGHNGGGKTTTIKCILSLVKPTTGTVSIFGQSNRQTSSRKLVGYVPEQPYFYDHLTVTELVTMYGRLVGLRGADLNQQVVSVLELLGIADRSNARMRTLSKGLTQRVAMAQALVGRPRLLVLDEPFSGLDPLGRKNFKDLLSRQKQQGTTIFISTHIIGDIEALCDRASIIVRGEIKGVFDIKNRTLPGEGGYELALRSCPENVVIELTSTADEISSHGAITNFKFNSRQRAEAALQLGINQ
jgi:ABC-2 type transport system ATP-binding protein